MFDARDYWHRRISADPNLRGVGYYGLGEGFNRWMYRVRRAVFQRELRRLGTRPESVLDVGSGTGFYVDLWLGSSPQPPRVTAVDFAPAAVDLLRGRDGVDAHLLDISTGTGELPQGAYDHASCMDVLFHVTDDAAYEAALEHIGRLVKPGGWFFYSDNFVRSPGNSMVRHQVHRSLATSERALERAGFEVRRRVPMFVLMNMPVDRSALTQRVWLVAARLLTLGPLGFATGALAYPVERALLRLTSEGPSTELIVARKTG